MDTVRQKVLNSALKQLVALKLDYAIKLDDGTIIGTLRVEEPKPEKGPRGPRKDYSPMNLTKFLSGMEVGDVRVFDAQPWMARGFTLPGIRSNISSHGCVLYGNGNFTVCLTGTTVECMRTG